MDLRYLRHFVAVAEELSFTRAAAKLNMSQPPLSLAIRRFEASLGFDLFERTKREISLTKAGKILFQESQTLLDRAKSAAEHAQSAARGETNSLKVAFAPWADHTTTFSRVVEIFSKNCPAAIIDFRSMMAPAALAALRDERIDVAFVSVPSLRKRFNKLKYELVLSDPIVVALPEKHALARRRVVSLESLSSEPQIVVSQGRTGHHLIEQIWKSAGLVVRPRHIIDHPQTTLALVSAGMGVSLVPTSCKNSQKSGVVYRPIRPSPAVNLIAAWRCNDTSSVLKEFLGVLRGEVRRSLTQ
jgi:DNA-binding transcriptional LysR family regulator